MKELLSIEKAARIFPAAFFNADGGTRTHTKSPPKDFESFASAIPPHPQIPAY